MALIRTPQPGQPNTYAVTPEQIQSQIEFAQGLRKQGSSMEPMQGTPWLQALARGLQGGLGGYDEYSAGQSELKERQRNAAMISQLTGEGKTPTYADLLQLGNDPWTSQNSMLVASKMVEDAKPDYGTFTDPSGDVYRWNKKDPNAKPELYFKNTDETHILTPEEKTKAGWDPADMIVRKPNGDYENLSKGGGVNINTGDNQADLVKEYRKKEAQNFADYTAAGTKAGNVKRTTELLKTLAKVAPTGPIPGYLMQQFPALRGFSDAATAFQAQVKSLIPTLREPGSGPQSDSDAINIEQSSASLINTPQGNALILEAMEARANIAIERAQAIRAWNAGKLDENALFAKLDELDNRSIISAPLKKMLDALAEGQDPNATTAPDTATEPTNPKRIKLDENGNVIP